MNITVMERQPDGTIKTYEPVEDTSDMEEIEETAMRLTSAKGASE
jgi:hypothetical protein